MAVLSLIALIIKLYFSILHKHIAVTESVIRYFSYFTIQGNILVTVCAGCLLFSPKSRWGLFFFRSGVRSALTVYILIVGLVYNVALRHLDHLHGAERFANEILHVAIPILFLVYWIVYVPKKQLNWNVFPWLIYPLIYGICTLIRGAFADYYPYPFLNVIKIGYPAVMLNFGVLLILFLGFSLLLVAIAKLFAKRVIE